MNKDQIIEILRQNEAKLHDIGVAHAALFGSVARGEADEKSDIDIAVTIDPQKTEHMTIYDYAGIKLFVAGLFENRVDVVNRECLKPYIKECVEMDAIDAF